MSVNLTVLDDRGLKYPDPDWTWEEADALFRASSFLRGHQRWYGLAPYFNGTDA